MPGFDISTDQTIFTFAPTDKKIITATIKFLPLTDSDRLIDLQDSADLWGVRILHSSGHRVNQTAKLTQLIRSSDNREALVQQYRNKPDFHRFTISRTQPYTKSIDLNEIYNLVIPGTYQMQLIYDNESIGIWGSGERIGFFAGNVFTVTVTAP